MERSDEELLSLYLRGDEQAFGELVKRHLTTVYSFVVRFVGDQHDAEDIVQETFLKAWKSARSYKEEASKFKTWVLRIARNTAIDHLRKKKHVPFSAFDTEEGVNVLAETVPDSEELPDEKLDRTLNAETLNHAMQALAPEAREILLLHYTNGLTFLEIGELLDQPQNTVKSRHHRAVLSLRKALSTQ
ncbi:MAG: polymerase sigma-70 factor, subfamily [Patescibacteria group bacterium]|jgi:RNA polymerase sigma-70 factor (ECF subfamily)|nr:polymerase sigma-70 factor, subfamily [Patescibacteria group bacterium]